MNQYDYVFVTHLPAFYKVNLYNEIAKRCKVFVIFVSKTSTIRTPDFTAANCCFEHCFLNDEPFEERSIWHSLYQLQKTIRSINYKKIVVGGWDLLEFWMLIFISARSKNNLALESSIYESRVKGIRAWLKKLFLSRISLVFPSGQGHQSLLKSLQFTGATKITHGVGIFNYSQKIISKRTFQGRYLYVGRLAPEKNILMLLAFFALRPQWQLTLIGQGPLLQTLQQRASSNVIIKGHIPNELLAQEYQQHDVFILPSFAEPWGLVVEEALFYGLPVVVSNRVGCANDLVLAAGTGAQFSPDDPLSLEQAIQWVNHHYDELVKKISHLDFQARDRKQVQQYLGALA